MGSQERYAALLRRIFAMRPKKHKDLSLVNKAVAHLGDPHKGLRYIHVTGTNGKGSVCWKLATALQEAGFKVGLFTSPHISSYRERFRINGDPIGEEALVTYMELVMAMADSNGLSELSFFDVALLVAFLHFRDQQTDVVVMEVGIGGRLDPTNIIPPSCLAVITSVALEHVDYLGDTVEKIAWEKSHIIKEGMPAVVGPRVPLTVVEERVAATHSPLYRVEPAPDSNFDAENRAVVAQCIEVLRTHNPLFQQLQASATALESTPPCRCEVWEGERLAALGWPRAPHAVVFDVGHNPDALQHLFARLGQQYPGKRLVGFVGTSTDKDVSTVADLYARHLAAIHVVPVAHFRLMSCQELHGRLLIYAAGTGADLHVHGEGGGDEAAKCRAMLQAAMTAQGDAGHVFVVTGSFFIMRAMRAAFGLTEPSDPLD